MSERLLIVSNRLPISVKKEGDEAKLVPSSGGLVSALLPLLESRGGVWVGWPGEEDSEELCETIKSNSPFNFALAPVAIDKDQIANFYHGFSNQIIWPLFHDLQDFCNFEPDFWQSYQEVLGSFNDGVMAEVAEDDVVWVHDFHLMGLGLKLRQSGVKNKIGFFLHIPFPSPDIFTKLPWRREILTSLLEYDLIGFQAKRDLQNFVACLERLEIGLIFEEEPLTKIRFGDRNLTAGVFPISIDVSEFETLAADEEVEERAELLRADMGVKYLALGVDRLDYTKGILYRIRAFAAFLREFPAFKRQVTLLQVVIPSREDVDQYQGLKSDIEKLVTQVNGELGEPGWVPVQHLFRSISKEELAAMYLAADVGLVTPLKDGMNLVSKEYCASQGGRPGILILSEFAGAADELGPHCFLVNPYDIEGVAGALARGLQLPEELRREKMEQLRKTIKAHTVHEWADCFLNYLTPSNFPRVGCAPKKSETVEAHQ